MKLSLLLKNDEWGAYLIGTVYAFQYKSGDDYISLFSARNQKSTNHFIDINTFYDQIRRIELFYKKEFQGEFEEIKSNYVIQKSLKNQLGLFSIIKNDVKKDLHHIVIDKLNESKKNFAINFLRGVIDSRSSADTTTIYIAMDIRKEDSIEFNIIMHKAFETLFGNKQQYNINPRFKQPQKASRKKNPQFRVPYTIVFGKIGTFRIQFFEKMKKNKNMLSKFQANTKIPQKFESIIKWDTSNITYTARNKDDYKLLEGDVEYLKNYSLNSDKENLLYNALKKKYSKSLKESEKRSRISYEKITKIINKHNKKDFLEPSKKIETNKKNEPLIDLHHIIPYKFNYLFKSKEIVDDENNLVPLRQDTHYFLHRGQFNTTKIFYLKKLYNYVKPFLIKTHLKEKINFLTFKQMY